MANLGVAFNRSAFSRFLNSPAGRIFRLLAGVAFVAVGLAYRDYTLGIISIVWGLLPLSAGAFDICYVSAILGGPLSGKAIRSQFQPGKHQGNAG